VSLKPPRRFSAKELGSSPLTGIEHELMAESAQRLGHAARALKAALDRLADAAPDAPDRATLVAEAGELLWFLVVLREACGFRDSEAVMRDYRVPSEVRLRMGMRRPPSNG
jgi:hypothetical protein